MQGLLLLIDYIAGTINLAKFLWLRSSWAQREEHATPVSIYEHAVKLLSKCDVILCKEEDTYLVTLLRIYDC